MHKLRQRIETNTPTDIPQLRSNCALALNKVEKLSVSRLKTCFNNPQVDQRQHKGGFKSICGWIKQEIQPVLFFKFKIINLKMEGQFLPQIKFVGFLAFFS